MLLHKAANEDSFAYTKTKARPYFAMMRAELRLQEGKADRSNDKDTGMIFCILCPITHAISQNSPIPFKYFLVIYCRIFSSGNMQLEWKSVLLTNIIKRLLVTTGNSHYDFRKMGRAKNGHHEIIPNYVDGGDMFFCIQLTF